MAATGKVSLFKISKLMGNSVAICEKHYAAYLPGAHKKLAGLLDAPTEEKEFPQTAPEALAIA